MKWLERLERFADGIPIVAIEDPSDEEALTAVTQALGTQPRFGVATRSEILRVLGPGGRSGVCELTHFDHGQVFTGTAL
jgi:hypothetical protein